MEICRVLIVCNYVWMNDFERYRKNRKQITFDTPLNLSITKKIKS